MRERIQENLGREYEERSFPINTNKFLGITVQLYPITEEDLMDCGGGIQEQFETSLDDYEKLLEILDETNPLCSVHKAHVSIAKFRNAIDDEDKKKQDESSYGTHGEMKTEDCNIEPDYVYDDEPYDEHDDEEELTILFCVLAAKADRGVADFLVHPVFHGWRRSLSIIGYMQTWKKKILYKKHLRLDEGCRFCILEKKY